MSSPRLFTARAVTPVLAASVLLIVAVAWSRGTGTVSAATAAGLPLQAGGSCLLTSTQELNSIKTWLKMMPVFRHPRCLNCHGGIPKPLKDFSTKHAGVVQLDSSDNAQTCEECHAEGWGDAAAAPTWTNKTDVQICRGMHISFDGDARSFLDHIVRDGGRTPFIKLAFEGKRGLTDGGQTIYEAETGRTMSAASPPGSHAQFIQQAKDWVAAQGGSFNQDPDCGCVLDRVEVRFHSAVTIVTPRVTSTITGDGNIDLKLGPEASAPTWDVALGVRGDSMKVAWSGVSISQPAGCQGKVIVKASPATQFKVWLGMSYTPDLKLSLKIVPGTDLHQVINRCLLPNGRWVESTMNDPISIFGGAWMALHGQSAADLMLKTTAAMDNKLKAMDPKAIQAMAEAMKNNPDPAAAAAQMKALMNQLVPGASQIAGAAKSNFSFAIPDNSGCSLGTGTAFLARCDFDRTITVPAGAGPSQTITEQTTITIGRPKP